MLNRSVISKETQKKTLKSKSKLKTKTFQPKIICYSPSPTKGNTDKDHIISNKSISSVKFNGIKNEDSSSNEDLNSCSNREIPELSLDSDKNCNVYVNDKLYNRTFLTLIQPSKIDWFPFKLSISDMERELKIDSFFLKCSIRRFMEIITETYIDKDKVLSQIYKEKNDSDYDIYHVVNNLKFYLNGKELELTDNVLANTFKSEDRCNIKIILNK